MISEPEAKQTDPVDFIDFYQSRFQITLINQL